MDTLVDRAACADELPKAAQALGIDPTDPRAPIISCTMRAEPRCPDAGSAGMAGRPVARTVTPSRVTAGNADAAPAFAAIANQPSTTELALKAVSSDQPPKHAESRDRA